MAIVKSRDMHWGLLAQKDHKDISFASLRLLLVADGANPCKLSCGFVSQKCSNISEEKLSALVNIEYYDVSAFSTGSLTSCDAFLNLFQSKGLKPEAICPCASSSEALTVSIRR